MLVSAILAGAALGLDGSPRIVVPSGFTKVDSEGSSALYEIKAEGEYSSGPAMLLDLHGTRSEQGYAFGRLGGAAARDNYLSLIGALINATTLAGKAEVAALELVVDWQWSSVLSKQLPAEMAEELAGFAQGCAKKLPLHTAFCQAAAGRVTLLANLPGDVSDIAFVLLDELPHAVTVAAEVLLGGSLTTFLRRLPWPATMCSMWAAWGSRTLDGSLFSGRNLDWNENTGIDRHKLISVFHPPGRYAHAAFGFGGVVGALTGMSAKGLTVHEANLESDRDSFHGFPWLLRLRYIMERAATLSEAEAIWRATNNTIGFNHMVASASDRSALVMETNAVTTAFFADNDPREAAAAFAGPGRTILGAPMKDAVWRTNHGFDGRIVREYMWNTTHAYNDSDTRYHLIAGALSASDALVNATGAVGVTALVGQKGNNPTFKNYSACEAPFKGGSNVLSVAFDPEKLTAYTAWEDGAGFGAAAGNWRPAACNAYLQIDLRPWFEQNATSRLVA